MYTCNLQLNNNVGIRYLPKTYDSYKNRYFNSIVNILMFLYLTTTLVIPSFIANKIIFLLIMAIYIVCSGFKIIGTKIPIYIALIFIYGFLISVFSNSDFSLAKQFLFAPMVLLLFYPSIYFKVNIRKVIKYSCWILLFVDMAFIIYGANYLSVGLPFGLSYLSFILKLIPRPIFEFIEDYSEIAIGYRGFFGGLDLMVHMGSVPFLFFSTCLWCEDLFGEKKLYAIFPLILSLLVIIISTSRALLICSCLIVFVSFLIFINSKVLKKIAIFFVIIAIIFALVYLFEKTVIFDLEETSNNVKVGHFLSFFNSPDLILYLTSGTGLGSYYFSSGVMKIIAHTEITFLDYARFIGLPLTILFYHFLIHPFGFVKKTNKRKRAITCVFVIYLIMALTNPILVNSFGLFGTLWYWIEIYNIKKEKI